IRDRGWLREGMPADIVVYDLETLRVRPLETIRDLPDGDWRRVQKADGYRYTIVNGRITFEDGTCTGALPGKVLRSYDVAGEPHCGNVVPVSSTHARTILQEIDRNKPN